jgi:energy-converting hydrogenase Eha subunit H
MNGATTLTIDQGVGSVLGTSSVVVKPAQTTTYTLTLNGTISARATVTVASAGFSVTGSMTKARKRHTGTLLSNGKVLIAGGLVGTTGLASAELYDPDTGTFTATGSMTGSRGSHTATLLQNGKVLMVGGRGDSSAELYDPDTGTFTATGNTVVQRSEHTATLLQNGKVLITGSSTSTGGLTSAELYDPATGTFTATGDMTVGRGWHVAIPLPSGMVFLAGGYAPVTGLNPNAIASTEQYDPKTGVFTATGNMTMPRYSPTATLLLNGTVLLGGGQYGFEGHVTNASLELFDPATQKFASTGGMNEARGWYTATLLPGGLVLIAGGYQSSGGSSPTYLASAELYDPATGKCTPTGNMVGKRDFHTATPLANGTVLIAGGEGGSNENSELASAELYR